MLIPSAAVTSQKSEKPDVDGETTIGETTSTTGFFIVSLAKNLSLTPKQVNGTLIHLTYDLLFKGCGFTCRRK